MGGSSPTAHRVVVVAEVVVEMNPHTCQAAHSSVTGSSRDESADMPGSTLSSVRGSSRGESAHMPGSTLSSVRGSSRDESAHMPGSTLSSVSCLNGLVLP